MVVNVRQADSNISMKPIIFIFGPSGVGKSYLLKLFKKQRFRCVQIDTDSKNSFAANNFPPEWDNDFSKVNLDVFVNKQRECLGSEHTGAVISFPTTYRFTSENLNLAVQLGVIPVLFSGNEANCKQAAKTRINKKKLSFNLSRYDQKNRETFQLYSRPEYDIFRLEAFRVDGNRFSDEELKKQIADRIRKFSN